MDQSRIFDLKAFLVDASRAYDTCRELAHTLHKYSFVVVRDPRVSFEDNSRYLDLMERYFSQSEEVLRQDERPDVYYQVGVSKGQEKPRDHRVLISTMPVEHWPHIVPHNYPGDPRWRFFRSLGSRPEITAFPALNAPQVVPAGFEGEWANVMDTWGKKLLDSICTIAEMIEVAFNLPPQTLTDNFVNAPHLIAPNGANILEYPEGTIFNGFHYDLNWGTIHGQARFPGLRAWPLSGEPFVVRVPDGCLLFQVGKQLQWQTGGYLRAGFHEVVNLPETVAAAHAAVKAGRKPIRVSSTVFGHVASDRTLEVLKPVWERTLAHISHAAEVLDLSADTADRHFAKVLELYPPILAGDQVNQELEALGLK